jgi:hypothetical protein
VLKTDKTNTINVGGIFLMNDLSLKFLNNEAAMDEEMDELDDMFSDLHFVYPPADIVERIMQAVSTLPKPKPLSAWNNYDFFIAEPDTDQLS